MVMVSKPTDNAVNSKNGFRRNTKGKKIHLRTFIMACLDLGVDIMSIFTSVLYLSRRSRLFQLDIVKEFLTIAWEQVHLRSIFPFQYFSIGASPFPFIEHNDVNRALMSSNMQRQTVPLSRSEKCIVGTGLERQVALDSGVPAIAKHEGEIVYNDTERIILFGSGNAPSIPLIIYQRSNKNTCMHKKSQVQKGKCVKKGQILADGAATVGGELALGRNVLVAYMPWEGHNSEDAVLISEHLVYEDIYTSFYICKFRCQS